MKKYKQPTIAEFQKTIWDFYGCFGREFPWRNTNDPYRIAISEVMLQQTQTFRVIEKYEQFIEAFPSFERLAEASLRDVLSVWQGLGYNRRGKFLHEMAQMIVQKHDGELPDTPEKLIILPGIGPATAASIAAFAFNKPTVFIETNIRTVFIHFFFRDEQDVHDQEIMPLVAQSVNHENSREWYYAIMDYGVMLKRTMPNPSRKSKHHKKQSTFEGSNRQIRGQIIRKLTEIQCVSIEAIVSNLKFDKSRVEGAIEDLLQENIIQKKNTELFIL